MDLLKTFDLLRICCKKCCTANPQQINVSGAWPMTNDKLPKKRVKIGPTSACCWWSLIGSCIRLVPKSTTLDDLKRPLRSLLRKYSSFGAHRENNIKVKFIFIHYQISNHMENIFWFEIICKLMLLICITQYSTGMNAHCHLAEMWSGPWMHLGILSLSFAASRGFMW